MSKILAYFQGIFDWKYYVKQYSDLQTAKINNKMTAWTHFINYGSKENRDGFQDKKTNNMFIYINEW